MSGGVLRGNVHAYGKNVDTDVIYPGKYLHIHEPKEMGAHALEGIDEGFAARVKRGDIIVADTNFGCGSSRENAPIALKEAGISAVIASSFARIFYRNAFNIGLPIFEVPGVAADSKTGDEMEIDPSTGTIRNITRGTTYSAEPIPEFMQSLIDAGGLRSYVVRKLAERSS